MLAHQIIIPVSPLSKDELNPFVCDLRVSPALGTSGASSRHPSSLAVTALPYSEVESWDTTFNISQSNMLKQPRFPNSANQNVAKLSSNLLFGSNCLSHSFRNNAARLFDGEKSSNRICSKDK